MKNSDSFSDRLETQAKAKAALLEKAKQKDPSSDPEFAARQLARVEVARRREERDAEQRRAKEAERDRQRTERTARAAAKVEQARLAAEEAKRKAQEAQAAVEAADKEAARQSRKVRPTALGLQDLKSAIESRGK